MSVRVVVASKYGSPREVGQAIADVLGGELREASEVEGFARTVRCSPASSTSRRSDAWSG